MSQRKRTRAIPTGEGLSVPHEFPLNPLYDLNCEQHAKPVGALPTTWAGREPDKYYLKEGWPPPPEPTEVQPPWVPWPRREADPMPDGMVMRIKDAVQAEIVGSP